MSYFGIPLRNGVPIGLGSIAGFGVAPAFSPADLFSAGEQGAWYDPSDLTTLFTDSAGTTPVTAVEQFVGLMLDKSQNGVGTNGAKRVNLLTYSEQFNVAPWTNLNAVSITANSTTAPDGTLTADTITENTVNTSHFIRTEAQLAVASTAYTFSLYVKNNNADYITLAARGASSNYIAATFTLTGSGAVTSTSAAGAGYAVTVGSTTITSVGNGWFRCVLSGTMGTNVSSQSFFVALSDGVSAYGSDGIMVYTGTSRSAFIWGADLRLTSEAATLPTYQRIDANWYSTMAGNHATSTGTKRPKLAARYNLLTYTERFDNAAWTKGNLTVSANAAVAPDGTTTADKLNEAASNFEHYIFQNITASATQSTASIYLKAAERTWASIQLSTGPIASTWFNLASDGSGGVGTVASGVTATSQYVGNGWYRCTVTRTTTAATWYLVINPALGDGISVIYAGTLNSGILVWGADLRPTNIGANVPAYQRIADANTYDTTGFPLYLRFDGIDDSMYTPANLNLSGTDKATVFLGLRKESDANIAVPLEFSDVSGWTVSNGSFALYAPSYLSGSLPAPKYFVGLRGSSNLRQEEFSTFTAPISNVLAESINIGAAAASEISMRINGAVVVPSATSGDAGSGNLGNYPVNIGRRSTGASYFPGNIYSLIIAGSAVSAGNISATEQWVAGKTGIVIP